MALAFVEGKAVTNTSGTATTAAFTNTFALGQLVVVTVDYSTGTNVTTSVTDNATTPNTYTLISAASLGNGSSVYQAVYWAKITTARASPTVTVNYNATSANAVMIVQYFNGFVGTPTLDQPKSTLNATSTTVTSGASSATTQAIELVVGMGSITENKTSTWTLGSGYTNLTSVGSSAALPRAGIAMESKIISSTGAQTATFTISVTDVSVGSVVTFYDAASGIIGKDVGPLNNTFGAIISQAVNRAGNY